AERYAATPRTRDRASLDAIAADARVAALIHIAAHTRLVMSDGEMSGIQLGPTAGTDGVWQLGAIRNTSLADARLVVLSDCDSGIDITTATGNQFSIADAFLAAGAETVIATLWPVTDDDTRQVMVLFHAEMANGLDAASALASAMSKAREELHRPILWAPF